MGTVPETHVTVQNSDKLGEEPRRSLARSRMLEGGGRERMDSDQLCGWNGPKFPLSVSQRDMKAQRDIEEL